MSWGSPFVSISSHEKHLMGGPDCVLGHKDYYLKFCAVVIPASLLQNNMADFAQLSGTDFLIK